MSLCSDGRFKGMDEATAKIGITDNYYCPMDDFNFTLQGSFSSPKAKIVQYQMDYCRQDTLDWKFPGEGRKCKPKKESDKIIS